MIQSYYKKNSKEVDNMIISKIKKFVSKIAKFNAKIVKASNNKKLKSKTIYKNDDEKFIKIPNKLTNFINTDTIETESKIVIEGILKVNEDDYICPNCGHKMEIHDGRNVSLKHLKIGNKQTLIKFRRVQFYCNECNHSHMQKIPFKIEKHFITTPLYNYIKDLLSTGHYTNVEVSELTGVNRNIVKEIDKERLLKKYTIDGKGKEIIKPEVQAKFLGIDEFKLHNGYKYATHIINLENGHILWIEEGKKKQVVYNFINHVGDEWMKKVIAVACDMNSDFEEAFKDKYPHIIIVFDHFHIIKNYNEKVISEIRKDEQKRLEDEGKKEEAKTLKRSRYILTSKLSTLKKKDEEAKNNKVISKGSELFNKSDIIRCGGKEDKYNKIMKENKLLFKAEIIREKLNYAYTLDDKNEMEQEINEIIVLCEESGNKHLLWFARLLKNHFDGIVSHADYKISSGKIEGINNKIKTLRRQAYGYPDDEYFFLKLFDISRTKK